MPGAKVKRVTVRRAYTRALALKGNLDIQIDLDASRERTGRLAGKARVRTFAP